MRRRSLVWLGLLAAGAAGCPSDLTLSLDGLQCQLEEPRCVAGYRCDPSTNICVAASEASGGAGGDAGAGSGGVGGDASPAGQGGGGSDPGGAAGVGGASGGAPQAGQGGSAGVDAGAAGVGGDPDAGADAGCEVVQLFRDSDADGQGDIAQPRQGCIEPGWVTTNGDCRDDLQDVFTGQTEFFETPYQDILGPSFDYDCSNIEEPDPLNNPFDPPPEACPAVLGIGCEGAGSGYLPATPPRSAGGGVDPRCGSNQTRQCVTEGLACNPQDTTLEPPRIFKCH